jgi:hypothetical protein
MKDSTVIKILGFTYLFIFFFFGIVSDFTTDLGDQVILLMFAFMFGLVSIICFLISKNENE